MITLQLLFDRNTPSIPRSDSEPTANITLNDQFVFRSPNLKVRSNSISSINSACAFGTSLNVKTPYPSFPKRYAPNETSTQNGNYFRRNNTHRRGGGGWGEGKGFVFRINYGWKERNFLPVLGRGIDIMNGDGRDSCGTGSHILLSLGACSRERGKEEEKAQEREKHEHNIPLEQSPRIPFREEESTPSKPPSTTKQNPRISIQIIRSPVSSFQSHRARISRNIVARLTSKPIEIVCCARVIFAISCAIAQVRG
ncbi:hypothetical protein EYC80_005745 [Monilinia laxa]|uniref:Uncharacterized protein n=1 Tax=Monilinia laxa TaxID=61186 RepID=A0A5N6KFE9_MONLA|nr:hypothetical protein EYC80_005745 [Monilinia laxa]